MKFHLFLLFFALALSLACALSPPGDYITGNCTGTLYCTKPNAKCTADHNKFNMSACNSDSSDAKSSPNCCPYLQYCGRNSTCVDSNNGDECKTNSDCYPSLLGTGVVQCVSGYCRAIYGAGDGCNNNGDCYGQGTPFALKCDNTTNTCVGLALGQTCPPLSSGERLTVCAFPNYCGNYNATTGYGTCLAPLSDGATCPNTDGTACPPGYECSAKSTGTGTCTKIGTIKNGQSCGSLGVYNWLCESGNVCFYGTCTKASPSKVVTCTNNSDCSSLASNSTCGCGLDGKGYCSLSGIGVLAYGVDEAINLVNCLVKYNCSMGVSDDNLVDPLAYVNSDKMSCGVENCNSYIKKYYGSECDLAKTGGSCFASPYCGGFPVWAIIVIVVVAVILVLSVVIVVFLVLRKRRDYSSI